MGRESTCSTGDKGDMSLISGLGRSAGGGMATHSNILAWRIPRIEEPGGLQSIGSQRVRHDWSNWAQTRFSICQCFISFLWSNKIPLHKYATCFLSVNQLIGFWVASILVNMSNAAMNIHILVLALLFFSHQVISNSPWAHGLQHARLPCP